MTWDELDWRALERLRERFLHGPGTGGTYWETSDDLASYDLTYGERIGWKWDQVLRELRLRGWRPRSRDILDWGCGSGVAARRVIAFFGPQEFDSLTVWDHSPLAADFAQDAARRALPGLRVAQATPGLLAAESRIGLLILSHVLNEMAEEALHGVRNLLARSDAVLWVEPGTHDISRRLGRVRDELRDRFRIVAPCTHELGCPMFAAGNERHWCHFFAPPPSEIFADSNWVKFGHRAGIDLRSLPYCFVAAEVHRERGPPARPEAEADGTPALPAGNLSRVIGRVGHFKPYARLLNCDSGGLVELELPKRANPALFKQLERTRTPLVYVWRRDGNRILGGDQPGGSGAEPAPGP